MPGLEEDGESVRPIESAGDAPREDLSGEVVDHGVKIGSSSVEKPNNAGIDVPDLVWSRRSDTELRLGGMNAPSRSSPAMTSNDSVPCGWGGEDLAEALSEKREGAGRNVAVLVGGGHIPDSSELLARQLMRESPWAGGDIIEFAALLTFPRMISCRRQPENTKRVSE